MKKNICKDIIAVILFAVIALFLELVVFQWNACINPKYTSELKIENSNWETVGNQCSYSVDLEGKYVGYLYFDFESDEDMIFEISGEALDGYEQKEEFFIEDKGAAYLGRSACEVQRKVNDITITVDKAQVQNLKSVQISNKFVFFTARFLLFFLGMVIIYLLFSHRDFWSERPALVYMMLSLSLGIVIIFSAHYALDSWDEQIHYNNVYVESWIGRSVPYSDSAMSNVELRVPGADTIEEERWVGEWLNEHSEKTVLINGKGLFLNYNQFAYLPMILGVLIGRVLHLSYTVTFFLGKFMNLLFCTSMIGLAIHFSKYGKRILMCIGLVPTALFLFSSYSYDGFVLSLITLGLSLFLSEFLDADKQDWRRIMVSVIAITVGCFSKAVYIPVLAIYWILPKEKFSSKKQRIIFDVLIGMVILLVLATFVIPVIGGMASGTEIAGDYRGGDTSQSGQLGMIFSHPFHYTWILLRSLGTTCGNFFLGADGLCNFAYRGIYRGVGSLIIILTLFFAYTHDYGLEEEQSNTLPMTGKKRQINIMKIVMGVLLFATASLIWTALYLDFTPVGNPVINGVSPRYYLPLLLPFSFLFINRKLNCRISKVAYQRMLAILMYVGVGMALCSQMLL